MTTACKKWGIGVHRARRQPRDSLIEPERVETLLSRWGALHCWTITPVAFQLGGRVPGSQSVTRNQTGRTPAHGHISGYPRSNRTSCQRPRRTVLSLGVREDLLCEFQTSPTGSPPCSPPRWPLVCRTADQGTHLVSGQHEHKTRHGRESGRSTDRRGHLGRCRLQRDSDRDSRSCLRSIPRP